MGNYMSNQLSYRHTQRVLVTTAMEAGGCRDEFHWARKHCAGRKLTAAEVQDCIKWTSRLRRCMEGNECYFKNYIKIMDEGLDDEEGKKVRFKYFWEEEEDRWRWKWWTGMIRFPQPAASEKNTFGF